MRKILNKINEMPLFARLTLFVGIILILIFSILLFTAQYFYLHFVNKQFELRAKIIADDLARVSSPALLNYDEVTLNQNCVSISHQKDVIYVAVTDAQAKILSQAISEKATNYPVTFELITEKIDHTLTVEPKYNYIEDNTILEITRAIQVQNLNWGYLLIGLDLSELNQLVSRARWLSLVIGLVIIIFGIFSVQKITEKVIAPIGALIRGTEEVSAGNFDFKIIMKDRGEFGQLAQKFNDMTAQLNYYQNQQDLLNRKLHEYSEGLEEKIKERTRQLQKIQKEVIQIFHQIPIGLLTISSDGKIGWYNEELLRVLDIDDKNLLKDANIFSGKLIRNEAFINRLTEVVRSGKKIVLQEMYPNKNKDIRLLEIHSQPMIGESEEQSGFIFIITDITDQKELETRMNRAQRLESMGILAGGIAHDFNNALAIILPNAQMLKLRLANDERLVHYVETIEKATDQAAKLTNQILSFSRGRNRSGNLDIINLNELIEEFFQMISRVVSKKIKIKKELSEDIWNLRCDRTQLDQIIMNLTMNAIDAMPQGGELVYRTNNVEFQEDTQLPIPDMNPGKYVRFEIADTGCGVPSKYLDKIFDPFFSFKKESKGTGLGLSIVYGIIKGYNGLIDVRSEINTGTSFKIYLPPTQKKQKVTSDDNHQLLPGSGKILLVDDEELLRNTVSHMLTSLNYEVLIAHNGIEAVKLHEKKDNGIDLTIMDIQMPEMDGIEAATTIWGKNPDAKIVFSSGYAEPSRLQELRKRGVNEFLKKPYKIKDLVDIIQNTMNGTNEKR
jgi:signal transduction histidine kinase/CheY-like chemotaxis protein